MSELALTAVAALWGAAAGLFVPRAAYRFAVEPDETWRDSCPAGHTITGPAKGWLGFARCGTCTAGEPPVREDSAGAAPGDTERDASEGAAPGDAERDASAGAAPGDPVRDASAGAAPGDPVREDSAGAAPGDAERAASASVPSYGPASVPSYGPSTPLVSLATALLCAALALATGTRPELGVWLLLAPLGVLLAVVDFKVQRLPDALTLSLAAAALALLGVAAAVPEHAGEWLTALFGALALGGAYFVLFLINPNGMGFGDVKLVLGLGAVLGWYGWSVVFLGTFAGFLFGALYGAGLVVARRAGRKTSIPFGPFLIAGAYAGLLIGAYAA
ncbi:A24 family peptidase [Streptomyces sp. NPDC093544]|uniref:A24 family peptidase n=1 Tax=Streptomyces sp. NPDC093544 TaxID=3155200 RepID=UPI00342D6329